MSTVWQPTFDPLLAPIVPSTTEEWFQCEGKSQTKLTDGKQEYNKKLNIPTCVYSYTDSDGKKRTATFGYDESAYLRSNGRAKKCPDIEVTCSEATSHLDLNTSGKIMQKDTICYSTGNHKLPLLGDGFMPWYHFSSDNYNYTNGGCAYYAEGEAYAYYRRAPYHDLCPESLNVDCLEGPPKLYSYYSK